MMEAILKDARTWQLPESNGVRYHSVLSGARLRVVDGPKNEDQPLPLYLVESSCGTRWWDTIDNLIFRD